MIFWTSCGCGAHRSWFSCTNWIFWCFMSRAFAALNIWVLGVIFSIFYFSCEVSCSFSSGISNFLIHLFEYLFLWFCKPFVLLWVFAIFNLESYVLLFFWHPFKVWIWYLVVICFLLTSGMSFRCIFDYILELFPFVFLLCCYVFTALSFLLNFLFISFLVLFILCKLSCVESLLTCVGHSLMINSCHVSSIRATTSLCFDDISVSPCERASVRTCLFF